MPVRDQPTPGARLRLTERIVQRQGSASPELEDRQVVEALCIQNSLPVTSIKGWYKLCRGQWLGLPQCLKGVLCCPVQLETEALLV